MGEREIDTASSSQSRLFVTGSTGELGRLVIHELLKRSGKQYRGDGSRLFDRLRGPHATELVTPEGSRILIRPDGYIAQIDSTQVVEYAGAPTRSLPHSLRRNGDAAMVRKNSHLGTQTNAAKR